ncbi:MAG: hypothetical protein ACE5GE_08810 [Phycisphaerae bacterium]
MNGLSEALRQGQMFAEQHLPAEMLSQTVPMGIVILGFGVVVSVLGARLVRPVLTFALGLAGALAAFRFAPHLQVPVPITILATGLLVGLIGFWLHRLWVGIIVAMLASSVALSVFGYYRVLPELDQFAQVNPGSIAASASGEFTLPDPVDQAGYNQPSPKTWAKDFWAHLTARQVDVDKKIAVIGAGAALVGLMLGLLATRGALILCTALIGTSMVASGLTLIATTVSPEAYASALDRPKVLTGAWAGLFCASLVIQALLNRRPQPVVTAPADR